MLRLVALCMVQKCLHAIVLIFDILFLKYQSSFSGILISVGTSLEFVFATYFWKIKLIRPHVLLSDEIVAVVVAMFVYAYHLVEDGLLMRRGFCTSSKQLYRTSCDLCQRR